MDPIRFDRIAKVFADRKLSRRQALQQGGVGLAAAGLAAAGLGSAMAQDASPAATPTAGDGQKTPYLFLQSFQSGTIAAKAGEEGTYTVTLEHGLGQTVYFADRPSRDVGAVATPDFLEELGFPADNPPNAALVVNDGAGGTDIAVVELFNPLYDPVSPGVTYDLKVLANWENSLEMGFTEAPTDLSSLAPAFGSAHLFIDDCSDDSIACYTSLVERAHGTFPTQGFCWNHAFCVPCIPYYHDEPYAHAAWDYWTGQCNATFGSCNGNCTALRGG